MKIKYFQDTDTLYIELRATEVAETRDPGREYLNSTLTGTATFVELPSSMPGKRRVFLASRTSRSHPNSALHGDRLRATAELGFYVVWLLGVKVHAGDKPPSLTLTCPLTSERITSLDETRCVENNGGQG